MKLLLILLTNIVFITSAWADCSLKLRVNDSPPYYYQEHDEYKGLYVEQAKALADLVDCQITTIKAPWGRSLRSLKDGKIDLMANMSITEERKEFLRFLGPHHFENIVLVVSKDSDFEINSHEDLLNLPGKIAIEKDAFYGEALEQLVARAESQDKWVWFTGENQHSLNERVRLGRLAGFLDVAKPRYKAKGLKYHSFIINSSPVFFGFSKRSVNEELFKLLQTAFESEGKAQMEDISNKYE